MRAHVILTWKACHQKCMFLLYSSVDAVTTITEQAHRSSTTHTCVEHYVVLYFLCISSIWSIPCIWLSGSIHSHQWNVFTYLVCLIDLIIWLNRYIWFMRSIWSRIHSIEYICSNRELLCVWGEQIFFYISWHLCPDWHVSKENSWELSNIQIWASNSQYWPSYASLKSQK